VLNSAINAPDRGLTFDAAMNVVRPTTICPHEVNLCLTRKLGHTFTLDERIDDEGATCLALAIVAMAAMHE
jgi:hypothetical protein